MQTMIDIALFLRQFWGLWLMIFFLSVIAWVYWPRNKSRFVDDAMIPFREDANEERNNGGNS